MRPELTADMSDLINGQDAFPNNISFIHSISSFLFPLSALLALASSELYCTESLM